jgi:hypothetical protein
VTIGDGLSYDTKVVGHSLHLAIVVANAMVSLLEGAERDVRVVEHATRCC